MIPAPLPEGAPTYGMAWAGPCPKCGQNNTYSGSQSPVQPRFRLGEAAGITCTCGEVYDGRVVGLTLDPYRVELPEDEGEADLFDDSIFGRPAT